MSLLADLRSQGYSILRQAIPQRVVRLLREQAEAVPPTSDTDGITNTRSLPYEGAFLDLVRHSPVVDALVGMGIGDVRYFGHALIHKVAGEKRRPWHQDWWGWPDPISLGRDPVQVGCAYYLQKTTAENGALTVLPWTHCDRPTQPQIDGVTRNPMAACPGEVVLEVEAGDVCLFDARVMHCSQANASAEDRIGISLWYLPQYDRLADFTRAYAAHSARNLAVGWLIPEPPPDGPVAPKRGFYHPWWPQA